MKRFSSLKNISFFVTLWMGILLPAYACDCSRQATVKAHMYTLQTMLNTYYETYQTYPRQLALLYQIALKQPQNPGYPPHWTNISNPYSQQNGYQSVLADYPAWQSRTQKSRFILGLRVVAPSQAVICSEGCVLYQYLSPQHYKIYGTNKKGQLILDKNQVFILKNDKLTQN